MRQRSTQGSLRLKPRATHAAKFGVMTARDLMRAELGLTDAGLGGPHLLEPWSVFDSGELVAAYANLFTRLDGSKVLGDAQSLSETGKGWSAVTEEGPIDADAAVIALGPWSTDLVNGTIAYHHRGLTLPNRTVSPA